MNWQPERLITAQPIIKNDMHLIAWFINNFNQEHIINKRRMPYIKNVRKVVYDEKEDDQVVFKTLHLRL